MSYILAADVGGTNTRIGLSKLENEKEMIHYKHLQTKIFKN
jgi:glucokinase